MGRTGGVCAWRIALLAARPRARLVCFPRVAVGAGNLGPPAALLFGSAVVRGCGTNCAAGLFTYVCRAVWSAGHSPCVRDVPAGRAFSRRVGFRAAYAVRRRHRAPTLPRDGRLRANYISSRVGESRGNTLIREGISLNWLSQKGVTRKGRSANRHNQMYACRAELLRCRDASLKSA